MSSSQANTLYTAASALHTFRDITGATNERTLISAMIPRTGVGNTAPLIFRQAADTTVSALLIANLSSLPLDWAARSKIGGTHLNFYLLKQLPVLRLQMYLDTHRASRKKYVELIIPRVLQLTYVSEDMAPFATDLEYNGPPFEWDEEERHTLQSELDAIYCHMYELTRAETAWMLDAAPPGVSFPTLKRNELQTFGEYRTRRLVLESYDRLGLAKN